MSDYVLIVSPPVLDEVQEVVGRSHLTRKYRRVEDRNVETVMLILADADEVPFGDIKLLATAQAGSADYLVTEDNDVLVLRQYVGTRIVDAATFPRLLDDSAAR